MTSLINQSTNKTIVLTGLGGYDKLRIEYRPIPRPARGKLILKVVACGMNFSELMMRQGTYDLPPALPAILGIEASGIVADIGSDVTDFKVGDRVVIMKDNGLWTEYAEVSASQCFAIPDSMSFEDAAALLVVYVTAYQLLFDFGHLRPGQKVLVHMAAGGVGIAATQLCRTLADVTVFGTASYSKHELIKQQGVTHAIDYHTTDYETEVRRFAPDGIDIVLDPLNGADAVKGYRLLKRMGRIVHYGAANAVTSPSRSLWSVVRTYLSTRSYNPVFMLADNKSASGYHLGRMIDEPNLYKKDVVELFKLYEQGKIKPVIDSVFSYENVDKAMARMHERQNVGKVLITPGAIKEFVGKRDSE